MDRKEGLLGGFVAFVGDHRPVGVVHGCLDVVAVATIVTVPQQQSETGKFITVNSFNFKGTKFHGLMTMNMSIDIRICAF